MPVSVESIFSVDVEDWFHILDVPSAPDISVWSALPSRVEKNFQRLLDIFDAGGAQVTCFFLGWVAERFPHLVREAAARGHEIASHGYGHQLAFRMTRQEFGKDVRRSRSLLEDIVGEKVVGYRAAGFSRTQQVPWFFEELREAGYLYDSSVFPARRGHGGEPNSVLDPHWVADGALVEFPITVAKLGRMRVCLFGGGYLRLFPYTLIHRAAANVISTGRPVIYYIHPREIDPAHPRLGMNIWRRFKTYVNLHTTEYKIRCILRDFRVGTFRQFLAQEDFDFNMRGKTNMATEQPLNQIAVRTSAGSGR